HRISAARDRHGAVRRAERVARRLADRGRPDAPPVRLAAVTRSGGGAGRGCGHGSAGANRHLQRVGPETGPDIEESKVSATSRRVADPLRRRGLCAYTAATGLLTISNDARSGSSHIWRTG